MTRAQWDALDLGEKTQVYFARTNLAEVWQWRWHNNWRNAFAAFRDTLK